MCVLKYPPLYVSIPILFHEDQNFYFTITVVRGKSKIEKFWLKQPDFTHYTIKIQNRTPAHKKAIAVQEVWL